jgi:hypothetical protein
MSMDDACIDLTMFEACDEEQKTPATPQRRRTADSVSKIDRELAQTSQSIRLLDGEIQALERKRRKLELRKEELEKQKFLCERVSSHLRPSELELNLIFASFFASQNQNMLAFLDPSKEFPWSREVQDKMQRVFRNTGFRPLQKEAIDCLLSGRGAEPFIYQRGSISLRV